MDSHAVEYYSQYSDECPSGRFHRVILLDDQEGLSFQDCKDFCPALNKGWYELSHLPSKDRLEFVHDFWMIKLPYHPNLNDSLDKFFNSLDHIAIYLTQKEENEPFIPHLIYSLKDNSGFFQANSPISEEELLSLQNHFKDYLLPADYTAFLQIHNGFAKLTDTGILSSSEVKENYQIFQDILSKNEPQPCANGKIINPKTLIPFYKSFGMPFFQCFWGEWYPESEMGNVYYSGEIHSILDHTKNDCHTESMAFETFIDWLIFYLEKIE